MARLLLVLSSYSISLFCFVCLQFFSLVDAKGDDSSTLTPINRDLYHFSEDLMEEIEALVHRHPNKLTIETFTSENKGYQAEIAVITYCRNSLVPDDRSKFRILLSFGQHGRELITPELAFRILSIISEEAFLPNMEQRSLNDTLDKLVIKVVPIENLNGRKLVEEGDLCERRNGRGVDLNRNWSVDWGKKEKDYDSYEENPGSAPFSEPETQIMQKLAMTFEPHVWVNVHSGMEGMYSGRQHGLYHFHIEATGREVFVGIKIANRDNVRQILRRSLDAEVVVFATGYKSVERLKTCQVVADIHRWVFSSLLQGMHTSKDSSASNGGILISSYAIETQKCDGIILVGSFRLPINTEMEEDTLKWQKCVQRRCLLISRGLLRAFFSLVDAKGDDSSTLTPINRDLYHFSEDLMEEIEALVHRHPNKLTIETFTSENKGYQAEIAVITYCRNSLVPDDRSKFRILLSFGQHGRELITSELAFRILSIISEEAFLPNMEQRSLNDTLDKLVIKVVPMENLNGRKLVEGGDLCERRNGRGVDLNRNWSVDWGKKEKDYDSYEENPGSAPFSEPETQIMQKLAMTFEPHVWVNVHSGMEALFMPYDHKNTTPDGLLSVRMKSMLKVLNHQHFQDRCMIGSGGGSVGYLAHGTATDYMYDIAKVPMAFTFEIYGDTSASSKDCFRMFNPIDHATFNSVLNDWSAAFLTIFMLEPRWLSKFKSQSEKWISIDEYLEGYLLDRRNRYGKKTEMLELGLQEIRAYYRLFMLSCVLLMFMFCTQNFKEQVS
ncbi:hypothetical protein Nepgr_022351 [Nepenthes gracilis]|uniref:Peptidase M14 domain-containing protein n=1 Tax=Nepenthes gracilis TaxID=150966 RepID=A0AAD3SZD2_NEPGR|nr:hypothetical protein Nepgr_022351 [Nepenthes gracilis]